jgi:glycosyltransferase involved in cell wall biosynthesis
MTMIFYTSINLNYMPKARLLASSVKLHMPDAIFILALLDDDKQSIEDFSENFDEVIYPSQLEIPDFQSWIFKHDVVEACTAQKARVLSLILEKYPLHNVVYLDPDIKVYSRFFELEQEFQTHDIILTPHITIPETSIRGIEDNEMSALQHGVFNLGFIGVKNNSNGKEFAKWWDIRLQSYCYDEKSRGLFTDQKWIDLVPGMFQGVGILRHPGYNIATWNILQRHLSQDVSTSEIHSNGQPVRFIHYSGYDSGAHASVLESYTDEDSIFRALSREYTTQLIQLEESTPTFPDWKYSCLNDGARIKPEWRRAYRDGKVADNSESNPFELVQSDFMIVNHDGTRDFDEIPLARFASSRDHWGKDIVVSSLNDLLSENIKNKTVSEECPLADLFDNFSFSDFETHKSLEKTVSGLMAQLNPDLRTVAMFEHGLGGGVSRHVDDLVELLSGRVNLILIHPVYNVPHLLKFSIPDQRDGLPFFLMYPDANKVTAIIKNLGVNTIHIHHAHGQELIIKRILAEGVFQVVVTFHDYYFLTPNWAFTDKNGEIIDFPNDLDELNAMNQDFSRGFNTVWGFATEWIDLLNNVAFSIFPSKSVLNDFSKFLQIENHTVALHPEFPPPELSKAVIPRVRGNSDGKIRVAIFGDFGKHKGSDLVRQIIKAAPNNLEFIGFGKAEQSLIKMLDEWHGPYKATEIVSLFQDKDIDTILIPTQIHETYSYAFSEALRSGLPVVATAIPVFLERGEHRSNVSLIELSEPPKTWVDSLVQSVRVVKNPDNAPTELFDSRNFYLDQYLEILST